MNDEQSGISCLVVVVDHFGQCARCGGSEVAKKVWICAHRASSVASAVVSASKSTTPRDGKMMTGP